MPGNTLKDKSEIDVNFAGECTVFIGVVFQNPPIKCCFSGLAVRLIVHEQFTNSVCLFVYLIVYEFHYQGQTVHE